MPLAPKGLNKSNIGGNAGLHVVLDRELHARCLVDIFPILHLDCTSALTCTRAQYTFQTPEVPGSCHSNIYCNEQSSE